MKITLMLAAAGRAFRSSSGLLWRSLRRRLVGVGRGRRGRRSIDGLRTLDDRLLADIGIDRASLVFADCHGRLLRRHRALAPQPGNVVAFRRSTRRQVRA